MTPMNGATRRSIHYGRAIHCNSARIEKHDHILICRVRTGFKPAPTQDPFTVRDFRFYPSRAGGGMFRVCPGEHNPLFYTNQNAVFLFF